MQLPILTRLYSAVLILTTFIYSRIIKIPGGYIRPNLIVIWYNLDSNNYCFLSLKQRLHTFIPYTLVSSSRRIRYWDLSIFIRNMMGKI